MRNAVQRRNHRERAQPLNRQKWGLLEKHKDYSLRAKDHKDKQKRLKILKEKATDRNPDEFSFKMMSSRTRNGQRIADRGNEALSMDVVRLLKTQDAGYIRTMLQRTRKEREALETEVMWDPSRRLVPLKSGNTVGSDEEDEEDANKIRFVDSKTEQRELRDTEEDEEESGQDEVVPKMSRREAEQKRMAEIEKGRAAKKKAHQQEVRRDLWDAVRQREENLAQADQELELQRAKMSNSIGGVTKQGKKFKIRERKR